MKLMFSGNLELAEIHGLKNSRVDMHSHLLPSFDDGVKSLEDSLAIIQQMKLNGLDVLFWTPHLNLNTYPGISAETIKEHFTKYASMIKQKTGVEMFWGSELFCNPPIPQKILPLGNSDFVLIEFPLDVYPRYLFDIIYKIQLLGYRVIMAHIERYQWLFPKKKKFLKKTIDYSLIDELKSKGVFFQINYSVLTNITKYQHITPILKEKKIEFIGSDKHYNGDRRPLIDFSVLKNWSF